MIKLLILPQTIEIRVNSNEIKYLRSKGYNCKASDIIDVDVLDLLPNSNRFVNVICDYCNSVFMVRYSQFNKSKKDSLIKKDCCISCKSKKIKESNLLVYGVESVLELPNVREKITNTNLLRYKSKCYAGTKEHQEKAKAIIQEKYGVDNIFKSPEIKRRIKNTMLEKYDCEYPTQSYKIKEKIKAVNLEKYSVEWLPQSNEIIAKMRKTMYKNKTAPSSSQQIYINSVLGGKLNYPVNNLSLDIAFPEELIYIEYDGGGHNLQLKLGNISKEDFKVNQIRRYYFLKSKGWKKISIISSKDKIPSDNILRNILMFAREYFNTGHAWIEFNIDNSMVKTSQFERFFNFGELIRVKKKL